MHQSGCLAEESQHLNGFGAQKRHARRVRFGIDARRGKIAAQVRPYLIQVHSGAGMVRFAPESASKTASFVASKANSSVCPMAAFDAAGTLATNWFSRASDSAASSSN